MLQLLTNVQSWYLTRADDERGATAVEYGMLVALIAAVIVATVAILGGKIETAFTTVTSKLP
jgi:pilus assembly protein Flp/PilA